MKRLGIMLSAILSLTVATQAADLGWNSGASPIYSPTPATGWSGFYAGVSGGYGFGNATVAPAPGAQASNGTGGWNLGGQAGYNMDMGGFILGAEGDLQWSNVGYSEDIPGTGTFKAGVDFYGTLRGRAGMAFGQVMPYVTAGIAAGRGTASLTNPGGVTTSQSATHMGWTAGVGLEAQATSNISIKAEYLYVDLGTQSYSGLPAGIGSVDATQRFSVVRAGLNYKF
jgi:outer membrane immunogenic protein